MTMGERITALRKGRGMTQEQLAEKLSVSRQSVSKWELDQATPEVGCAVALCDLFGVSLDYLIRGMEAPPPVPEEKPAPKAEQALPKPTPTRPKPLTAKGYVTLFGLLLLLTAELCLHLLFAFRTAGAEAGMVAILLIFGAVTPLPAVYLATRRWYYTDHRQALRHLWGVASVTAVMGNLLLMGGLMLYLRCFADEFTFWSVGWAEVWCKFLTVALFALALLLPFLLRFHERKWLCWMSYALSQGVYMPGLILDFELTDRLPAHGTYGTLWDAAVRLGVILLLVLSQVILYTRLNPPSVTAETAQSRPSPWVLWGIPLICAAAVPSVLGGLYYALSLAGHPSVCLPVAVMSLPPLLTVLLRGRDLTFRRALTETGKIAAISLPLTAAAHMAAAYLAEYLLTFGGPVPDAAWGKYGLWSLIACVAGGIVTVPLFAALRKRPLLCGLLSVLLLLGAVAASILLPNPLYPL